MNTPADIVKAVFEAMNLEDWKTLGDLCDPVGLRLFKNELIERATTTPVSMAQLMGDDESEGEEWKREGANEVEDYLRGELYEVLTLEELQAMDPAKVFARWVQGKAQRQYRALGMDEEWESRSEPMRLSHSFSFVVLGSVIDTDGIAHVIYRNDRDVPFAPAASPHADAEKAADDELRRILCVRSFVEAAVCRQQPDGSWLLIPSDRLYLVPTMQIPRFG